jgi:hypothetical protein
LALEIRVFLCNGLGDPAHNAMGHAIDWFRVGPLPVQICERANMADKNSLTLLARVARIPDAIWGPVVAGVLILVIGLIGLAFGQPWLFPSLGPSAYMLSEMPRQKSSRFYETLAGHLVGLGAGFLAVTILNAANTPPVVSTEISTVSRVLAAALAVALTLAVSTLLRASHPPAAATTLLVALGSFQTANDALTVVIGVLILAVLGEIARQIRIRATSSPDAGSGR